MIGICVAASKEWKCVLDYFNVGEDLIEKYPYGEYFITSFKNKNILLFRSGTRKTKSVGATQYMIDKFNFDKLIVVGTSACVDNNYNLLDILIPNKVVQTDCSFIDMGDDFKEDYVLNIDLSNYIFDFNTCCIGTSDLPLIHRERCELLKSRGITLVDMESAAIVHTCFVNSIECIVIKGISDFPGNYNYDDEAQFMEYVNNIPLVMNKIFDLYLEKLL